jgi:predicted DNA-binding transcriptional regulator AlpA
VVARRELHGSVWPEGSRWLGRLDRPGARLRTGRSKAVVLSALRRDAGAASLTIEVTPEVVGVAEAAAILGWDKRRVFTYISRGSFPEPVALLASGRVWRRSDIEAYAKAWRRARR